MLNNIFNIRYNPRNNWKGQIEPKNGFCSFQSVEYGIRAAYIILRNYMQKGFGTLQQIITRFAPPEENPTSEYIKFVVKTVKRYHQDFTAEYILCSYEHDLIVDVLYAMMLFENHKQSKHITRSFIQTTLNEFKWS